MIALLQRVKQVQVAVSDEIIARIGTGLLVFIGVERGDSETQADRLVQRLLGYRVFADSAGKMNLNLQDIKGELLLVPQFTLAADTRKGMRPSFTPAAEPGHGEQLFNYLLQQASAQYGKVESGRFGADMQVMLTNDGPVTFWLKT
ncbi:MAG TPA: D-aminoacyl-tRNA deacylase [Gammaproteobacteria bacterium]|nr:D-aminoacyl-tRNA deacylase [Gammaproteobacteria bacterium]